MNDKTKTFLDQLAALCRPNASGYWWTRPDSGCMWRIVEITICSGAVWIREMGDEQADILVECPWWEWCGPLPQPFAGRPTSDPTPAIDAAAEEIANLAWRDQQTGLYNLTTEVVRDILRKHLTSPDWQLPGGYRCEKCRATGPYPIDDTTPGNAFRILFDSCPACDPAAEDSYRYIDASGRTLSILA